MPNQIVATAPQQETAVTRELTYSQAVREALQLAMRRDKKVFMLGEDIGVYGGAFGVSDGLLEEFSPERVRDTPISEAVIAGAAVGAAMTGMRPVAEIQFMDFITLSMEQLVLQGAKIRFMFGGKATVPMVPRALEAAETLAQEGIELEVVDPRTLKPYDAATVTQSVVKTGRVLVVHEAPKTGGFGGEVVAEIVSGEAFDYLDAPARRLAGLDVPIPYNRELERAAVPQVKDIVRKARALVQGAY
jgi:pyruvate/2-oxoglutarate/acetoin dehydrogenase E1 component